MIEFWLVEWYIRECLEERVPRLATKRRIVDSEGSAFAGTIAEVERTIGGDVPTAGPNGDEIAPAITLVYLETETTFAVALLRRERGERFDGALGERYAADFRDDDVVLVVPGRPDLA